MCTVFRFSEGRKHVETQERHCLRKGFYSNFPLPPFKLLSPGLPVNLNETRPLSSAIDTVASLVNLICNSTFCKKKNRAKKSRYFLPNTWQKLAHTLDKGEMGGDSPINSRVKIVLPCMKGFAILPCMCTYTCECLLVGLLLVDLFFTGGHTFGPLNRHNRKLRKNMKSLKER